MLYEAWTIARLNPLWQPWQVPRVVKLSTEKVTERLGMLDKLLAKRKEPTQFQRCLAIHIINATHHADEPQAVNVA